MAAAASGTTPILFQDQFEVKDLSRKFEKVTRYSCRLSDEGYDMSLEMDINSDIFPLELNDRFTLALASTLALDGKPDTGVYDQSGIPSLADQYDYVMYGKLYKWKQEQPKAPIEVQVSFGGLLMLTHGAATATKQRCELHASRCAAARFRVAAHAHVPSKLN
jgi:DNA-directed RNA polymerase I, II, and III subunit RPABC3